MGRLSPHPVAVPGAFKNFNTIEDFKAADKTPLFNQASDEVSLRSYIQLIHNTRTDR